jgi:hypothetical protein
LHGVATPVNEILQDVVNDMASTGAAAGSIEPDRLLERVLAGHERRIATRST